jgi:uncharacterized protein (TIGR02001 family)
MIRLGGLIAIAAIVAVAASSAGAADLKMPVKAPPMAAPESPWEWAFGGALLSDYNFRGISQSNRGPSATVYSETRFKPISNLEFYFGSQYWAVTLPTNPTCECDIYGGIRPTFGPLAFDFGAIYYWYPRERQHAAVVGASEPPYFNGNTTLPDTDMWEVYAKLQWEVVKDRFWLGFNEYYSPSWLHTGAWGNIFSGTAKVAGQSFSFAFWKDVGWYVSGEVGYYSFGTTNFVPGVFAPAIKLPNYTFWNVGLAFTYKVFTLDFRYYDTNLSKTNCNVLTGDPGATPTGGGTLGSRWCSSAFITALKFDLTLANLK